MRSRGGLEESSCYHSPCLGEDEVPHGTLFRAKELQELHRARTDEPRSGVMASQVSFHDIITTSPGLPEHSREHPRALSYWRMH